MNPARRLRGMRLRNGADDLRATRDWQPPLERPEFWAVQLLVFTIAGAHTLLELSSPGVSAHPLQLVPTSLFLVPVVYAALNFGLYGSVPTALWSTVLTIPNILLWHEGEARGAELWQVGVVLVMAVVVGRRVDEEKRARREAERREEARRVSEAKFRAIFDSVGEAILVLDDAGRIDEANTAAGVLFDRPADRLLGVSFESLAGRELADAARASPGRSTAPIALQTDAGQIWIEPVTLAVAGSMGVGRTQVMLRNVTLEHERRQGLEGYARWTLAAREEEQRRIARDLHDGPLQSLVLLWRKLDALEPVAPDHRAALGDARVLAEQVADELRRFSRDLRPSVLDDLGLAPALKSEAAAVRQRTGVSARVRVSGTVRRLSPDLELTLLRIAQEALRNVEKHAEASSVLLHLAFRPTSISLSISDDGRGLGAPPAASELLATGRLGLIGMQERARLVGAGFSIRGRRSGGTAVEVTATT